MLYIIIDNINDQSKEEDFIFEQHPKKPYKGTIKCNKKYLTPLKLSFNILKIDGQDTFAIEFIKYYGYHEDFINFIL